jgi:MtrB/PioB family decaheme-associated outer membrane protein
MSPGKTLSIITMTAFALAPFWVNAQSESEEEDPDDDTVVIYESNIDFGFGYLSEDSAKFGEWTGLDDQGVYAIGSFTIRGRPAYDGDSLQYWEARGSNLGLDSRSLSGEYGVQGKYELSFSYDKIPHLRFDDASTPFRGVGTSNLTLPSPWTFVGGDNTTSGMTNLNSSLQGVDIETERERYSGGVKWHPARGWDVAANFRHETKDGLDVLAVAFGNSGGNAGAMEIPKLIDEETNEFDVSIGYGNKRGQMQLAYQLSLFDNRHRGQRFQNPYNAQPGGGSWAAGAGFPTGVGEFALSPDNLAHNITFSSAYNVNDTTRLTANFAYSHMSQDEQFLPYTANSLLTVTTPLPRQSLDGEIDTILLNLSASARPMPKMDLHASYRYYDLDNSTPEDVYIRIAGDAQNQDTFASSSARINDAYSYSQQKISLKGGYRLHPRAKFTLGYDYEQKHRDVMDVGTTEEHTLSARVSGRPTDTTTGSVQYAYATRDGGTYRGNAAFLESHTDPFLAGAPTLFENDPRLRRFFVADRDRNLLKGTINFMPMESPFSVGLHGSYTDDDYPDSPLGIVSGSSRSATLDFSYAQEEELTFHGFVGFDRMDSEQLGCSWNSFSTRDCIDNPPALPQQWRTDIEDEVYTAGLGIDWEVNSKLQLGADYTFSRAMTTIDTTGGTALTTGGFPDIVSRLHGFGVHADYNFKKNMSVRAGYRYQNLKTRDWAVDGIEADSLDRVIALGVDSPDYHLHLIGLTLKYEF